MSATSAPAENGWAAPRPLVLSCSPRSGGNSDTAARLFASACGAPGALFLRDIPVLPCVACDACSALAASLAAGFDGQDKTKLLRPRQGAPFLACPLSLKDSSAALLSSLALAPAVCITAPVYFYHVPAMLKALLDRMQPFWAMQRAGIELFAGRRPCRLILMGARKRGEKLFEGSLLSLRCALEPAGLRLVDPLLFYGMEEAGDLAADARARELIAAYGADAAREIRQIGKDREVRDHG